MYTFTETQKFRQWWIWAAVSAPYLVILLVFLFLQPREKQALDTQLWTILFLIPLVGVFFILVLRLATDINTQNIRFRFIPFHFKTREIDWSEIDSAYVRKYKPMREFGGWGIRQSFKNGKAFTVSGNKGLQLVLKNGKKILIGTQKPEDLELFLLQIRKNKE